MKAGNAQKKARMRQLAIVAFVTAVFAVSSGCKTIMITKKTEVSSTPEIKSNIVSSSGFERLFGQIRTVAFVPPNVCLSPEGVDDIIPPDATRLFKEWVSKKELSPDTRDKLYEERLDELMETQDRKSEYRDLMFTICGSWMRELEQSFVSAGYSVVASEVFMRQKDDGSVYRAFVLETAQKYNVDLLFSINALKISEIDMDGNYKSVVSFTRKDINGKFTKPRHVFKGKRAKLMKMVPEWAAAPEKQIGAELDISAIDTNTGQSVWFYRETVPGEVATEITWQQIVRCGRRGCVIPDKEWEGEWSSTVEMEGEVDGDQGVQHEKAREELIEKSSARFLELFSEAVGAPAKKTGPSIQAQVTPSVSSEGAE